MGSARNKGAGSISIPTKVLHMLLLDECCTSSFSITVCDVFRLFLAMVLYMLVQNWAWFSLCPTRET
jgi:hypothetical protein